MQRLVRRPLRSALFLLAAFVWAFGPAAAHAARIGVLSNKNFDETAGDFQIKIPGHTFTGIDVSSGRRTGAKHSGPAQARVGGV